MDIPINNSGGAIGFVGDYIRWVTGDTLEQNIQQIQETIILRIEQWAKESGAVFERENTKLIHFTRKRTLTHHPQGKISFQGASIEPEQSVKVLGVILDSELWMKQHMGYVASKAKT